MRYKRLLLKTFLLILFIETSVLSLLNFFTPSSRDLSQNLIHAALLNLFSAPFLWWFVVRPLHTIATMEESTERKLAEERLFQSQQDWESTFNTITDMITIHDKDFNIIRSNKAAEKILGLPILAESTAKCFHHYHGTACPPQGCPSCQSLVTGQPSTFELFEPHLKKHIEIRAIPRFDSSNQIIGLIHIVRDISARKQIEERLTKSENELSAIIEAEPECLQLVALDGTVLKINPAGLIMMEADSVEQIQGKSIYPMIVPEYHPAYQALSERTFSGETGKLEYEILGCKGSRRWVETRTAPLLNTRKEVRAVLAVTRDITEHKKLEGQLRHAQKMEAVGTLTGGIAHDFNNILTAIIGYGSILKLKMKQDDPLRNHVEQILASTERAASLTQGLLTFSRKLVITLKPVNLNDIIMRVEKLLNRLIGENIALKTVLTDGDTTAIADSGQIEQVLMNLATNARDAMPDGGSLTITTEQTNLSNDFIKAFGYGKQGPYVLITVTDKGCGMDEATRMRIFEPFFTTKDVGKGTGLGLSMAYGIIKQHNGFINCESEPGRGTSFKIFLPRAKSSERFRESEATGGGLLIGGSETVLIAEDDADVRRLTRSVLEDFGYHVIEAENGEDAVEKFRQHRDEISLLFFDVVMPRMNGKQAYEHISGIKSGVKILFTSGYTSNTIQKEGIAEGAPNFILKPISPKDLLIKVREVLDT